MSNSNELQISNISSKIFRLAGRPPFMLDRDIAEIYETESRIINQAVKRNPNRFPEDFCFQLTKLEITNCDLKFDNYGGNRNLPHAFTREGCNMLSAVLSTPVAIERSIQIMRAFSALEKNAGSLSPDVGKMVMDNLKLILRVVDATNGMVLILTQRIERIE